MAMPCSPGLSPHSVWMVFSAPEITTVSNPKRNPARAEVSDQKEMRPFIVVEADLAKALWRAAGDAILRRRSQSVYRLVRGYPFSRQPRMPPSIEITLV